MGTPASSSVRGATAAFGLDRLATEFLDNPGLVRDAASKRSLVAITEAYRYCINSRVGCLVTEPVQTDLFAVRVVGILE